VLYRVDQISRNDAYVLYQPAKLPCYLRGSSIFFIHVSIPKIGTGVICQRRDRREPLIRHPLSNKNTPMVILTWYIIERIYVQTTQIRMA
jgi:hypothetical protein